MTPLLIGCYLALFTFAGDTPQEHTSSHSAPPAASRQASPPQDAHHPPQESIGSFILHHISDDRKLDFHPFGEVHLPHFELFGIDFSITKHVVMMMVAAALLLILLTRAARRNKPGSVPTGWAAAVDAVVEFIYKEIAVPNMGEKLAVTFVPYLCTAFFFILTCNLLGLVPFAATATGNVSVTAALASLTFLLTQFASIRSHGVLGYLKHLTGGVHPAMWIVMIPVEFLGLFTKPFALCIRLFANMTAGHVVILALINLIFIFGKNGANPVAGYVIAPVSVVFSLFVNLLEILVAFLQAYIFTLLSALFIGFAAAHSEHHETEAHPAEPAH
ncbi:MAG: F0F1 ATP synthase subunit A [candidate division KSB1 bacterium]|nr:F0F1 ATP synthase subunit A [candidate division KSB1 bacterium]MDZ7273051.1 F0F1 ATP synthase subunit A [candidate division KSB1 bacterium]MDZ7285154.1 F0F1 ATP synthase subunit A [candidate division KSB1 bacterium]MDZ7298186.1 F0F1 ATP synthase subunit A [candidate division KSB1 bacterium]MDZ7307851.1 F0F1 ATP synthase subunit A [candidate division KSB1 bacterium]